MAWIQLSKGRRAVTMTTAVAVAMMVSTHADAGPTGGALPPELVQVLQVAGANGLPADAVMVAANITAINPVEPGYLTVFPCDEDPPATSNVNYVANQISPNLVLSRIAADGTICIVTRAVTDLFVDLVGYVPGTSALTPLPVPVRALDTRGPHGDQPPLPAGGVLEIPIAGKHGVAADATVVMFNATAIAGNQAGYLTAYPCGTPPETSSVNYLPRQIVPNLVAARLSPAGSVCISTLSSAHVVVDVAAYATDGIETLTTPERIYDSRDTTGPLPAGTATTIDITDRADVPDDATAAVYNLTGVDATAPGFATSYPCDATTHPETSNLNYDLGQTVANGAITKLSTDGTLCVFNLAPTNLIVDLIGYTRGTAHYVPITPARAFDSRTGWEPCGIALLVGDNGVWVVVRIAGEATRVAFPAAVGKDARALIDPTCDYAVARDSDGRTWSAPLDGGPPTLLDDSPGQTFELVEVLDDGTVITRSGPTLGLLGEAGVLLDLTGASPSRVWVSTDGTTATQSDVATGEVRRWDLATGARLPVTPFPGGQLRDVSPDGVLALWRDPTIGTYGTHLTTWDGTVIAGARLPDPSFGFAGSASILSSGVGGTTFVPLYGGPARTLPVLSTTDFGILRPLIADTA